MGNTKINMKYKSFLNKNSVFVLKSVEQYLQHFRFEKKSGEYRQNIKNLRKF